LTTSNKGQQTKITISLVVIALVAAHLCLWLLPGIFAPWNAQMIDRLYRLRDAVDHLRPAYDQTIVHVDINNSAIQKLNNYYLNRSYYAQVVRNLATMGVALQAYDFIFASRLNARDDQALIDATREAGTVYFGLAFLLTHSALGGKQSRENEDVHRYLERTKWPLHVVGDSAGLYFGKDPLPTFIPLASVAKGLGFINIKPDVDGVFRRIPLLVKYDGGCYPSFSLRIVCDYLGVSPEKIAVIPGKNIVLKDARRPEGTSHDITIPIDDDGNMLVNFVGPWERMTHYNFADIYDASETPDEMETWTEELKGKIVLISDVSTGSSDLGPVPTDMSFPLSGLHANAIHTMLTEEFLREVSGMEIMMVELLLAAIILVLSLRFATHFFPIYMVLLAAGYLVMVGLCFLKGRLVLGVIGPLLMMFFAGILVTAYRYFIGAKEKEVLRRTFEAYFPPLVVKKIMANPGFLALGGQKKELTVLFSDIKDFTTHSADLTPAQIQHFLNEYFEAMVEVVFSYQGTVDKYIGDGLMVFFGDPEPQPDHALRCVRAAMEMQKRTAELREKWRQSGGFPIAIRIGINTGEVVVGNMGSARRLAYTVLGSAVNLAQRLETNAPVGGILISERTYDLVKEEVQARSVGPLKVKGIERPISAYEVQLRSGGESAEC
jgi:adenylate cyclase